MNNKCFLCNKTTITPISVTEISPDKSVKSFLICEKCRDVSINNSNNFIDLSHITTLQDLINFIVKNDPRVCECGLEEVNFDKNGRFGCPKCYDYFSDKMEKLVFPFHKNNKHCGKTPKNNMKYLEIEKTEKEKILKLNYAKALELENFEMCAKLKKELELLKNSIN